MKSRPILLLMLAAHAGVALAQYKCTAADGAITFQQTPCFGARTEEKLTVIPNGHPPAASGARPASSPAVLHGQVQSTDERMLQGYERQSGRELLVQEVKAAQDAKTQRAAQLQLDIASARNRYDSAAEASTLKDALDALNSRYVALSQIDDDHLQAAQKALADWDKSSH